MTHRSVEHDMLGHSRSPWRLGKMCPYSVTAASSGYRPRRAGTCPYSRLPYTWSCHHACHFTPGSPYSRPLVALEPDEPPLAHRRPQPPLGDHPARRLRQDAESRRHLRHCEHGAPALRGCNTGKGVEGNETLAEQPPGALVSPFDGEDQRLDAGAEQ